MKQLTEIQEKWLQALESGAYKQAFGKLRRTATFCCLGVACDVVDPSKWIFDSTLRYEGETCLLPSRICLVLGLEQHGTVRIYSDKFFCELQKTGYTGAKKNSLIDYNDSGASFKHLAKAIRAYPEAVFI